MENYLTYPCKVMRITQRYDGGTSHKAHMEGTPRDYSLDDGCTDGGRDWIFCCCDALRVVRITGTRNKKRTNSIWLTSTTPCVLANGKTDTVTLQFIHPNDDDLLKIKEGQIFRRGDRICREGNDGANGIHLHLAVGLGTITNHGWKQNTRGAWVLTTTGGPIKPEHAFFIDPAFTQIRNSAGLSFQKLPTGYAKWKTGNYKVKSALAPVRAGAGTSYAKKTFTMLSENAREQIKQHNGGKAAHGFVKGMTFSAHRVQYNNQDKHYWGECPSGWICLDKHCEAVR